jgi:integrase
VDQQTQLSVFRTTVPDGILGDGQPNRKREKKMSFRSGQSGSVVRKGQMWHGRYYVDIPNQDKRRKVSVPLGSVQSMKKPEAKRKLRTLLEEIGLNADSHLERFSANARTFKDEAAWWKENRLVTFKPSCQEAMGSHLDKYLLPRFGSLPVGAIDERRVQEFIADLIRTEYDLPKGKRRVLSPKTIRNIVGVLKQLLGVKVWRDWKLSFPESPYKEQRFFSPAEMRQIIGAVKGQWAALFATLAMTGLRAGEAFGLHVEDVDLLNAKITVRRNVWNGQELNTKTKRGNRTITLDPVLVQILSEHIGTRTSGRVFQTRAGTPFGKGNVRRKLREVLTKLKLPMGGLHAFRHGRVSVLQAKRVPGDLILEWVGHSNLNTTSGYTHFDDEFRKQTANETGLFNVGPNGPNFEQPQARPAAV